MNIYEILSKIIDTNASDLHLSAEMPPIVRVDGDLQIMPDFPTLGKDVLAKMLREIVPDEQKDLFERALDIDFAFTLKDICRFRANIFQQMRGISAAFRALPKNIPSFADLCFPNVFFKICEFPHGLVLVTGPTGSGKTTTMAAIVNYINQNKRGHILTIEDPIEYIFQCEKCLIQQREVKQHTVSFSTALRAALREDPDYILVGEMRDLETVKLALTAAETGHLVFATLHTNSAAESIDRILDIFPSTEKNMARSILANSLQAVISQILVKKIGGGRVAVQEIMVCTSAIKSLIREGKVPQINSTIQTGADKGMRTLAQHLQELAARKIILDGYE